MNNLSTSFPQLFHRLVDIFFCLLFPPKHEHKNVGYFSYFPDDIDKNSFFQTDIFCVSDYSDEVRKLIHRAKYFAETSIAKEMAYYINKNLPIVLEQNLSNQCNLQTFRYDFITCVPADPKRFVQRGYHIPEIMAKRIASLQQTHFYHFLKKNKHTKSQAELTKQERSENLKHVFLSTKIPLKSTKSSLKILLVDDTTTTGATLLEAKKAILKTYPQAHVDMVAFAGVSLVTLQK